MRRWLLLAVLCISAARAQGFDTIERGRSLAAAGGCAGCHTARGGAAFAGGRAVATPFGTLLTPNLTPDEETGIGGWSDGQFVRALQDGIGRREEHLYPGFPYPYYTHVREADLLAILAYLRTLDPVRNRVEANQLPFPFSVRAAVTAWNAGNFRPGEYRPDPGKGAEWNRGGYLVEGLGHCGACHTPKNLVGGDENGRRYRGGTVDGWHAPDLTGNRRTGLGGWTVDEVVAYLRTGRSRTSFAAGPMAAVVEGSTSRMEDADLRAMAVFLKDQAGDPGPAPARLPSFVLTMRAGGAIYADACGMCHTPRGEGVAELFPGLAGSASLQAGDATTLIRTVLRGGRAAAPVGRPARPAMPGFGNLLDDAEVAGVLNYVRNSWGNAAREVTPRDVRAVRTELDTQLDGGG